MFGFGNLCHRCIYSRVELFTHLAPLPKEFRSVTDWVLYHLFKSPQSQRAPLLTREEGTTVRRLNRLGALLGVAILVAGGFATAVRAAGGSLDTTFDSDGIAITNLGGTNDFGTSVAIQTDGKIVVAGASFKNGGYDFALTRYNSNGSLDTAFDGDIGTGNGIVITDFGGTNDSGSSVAIQADGKIVVAGYSDASGGYDFALVRYNSNGSLDTTFDSDGIAIANLGGTDSGSSVAIQTDGKIVVAGASYANGASDLALARFDATQPTLNPPRAPTPTPIVSLHHADLDPNGGSCLMNGTATTTSTRTAFLGYTYIPGAEECSRPGFTFQGWAIQTKPETVFALPLLRGWDDGVWRYFIADTYELIAVWKTIG